MQPIRHKGATVRNSKGHPCTIFETSRGILEPNPATLKDGKCTTSEKQPRFQNRVEIIQHKHFLTQLAVYSLIKWE